MLIVTGANGQLGRQIVQKLLKRVEPAQIGVSVRDPAKSTPLAEQGVRVRRGDFDEAASLLHAFEGATQVMIVSSNAESTGGDAVEQHRSAISAAKAVGAQRILYTSHMGAAAGSKFQPMQTHVATEAALRECGVPFTALRNGFYASSTEMTTGDVRQTRTIAAPADGKVSWTTHADLAAAAAAILASEGSFDGPTPPLTAEAALDLSDLAALAGDVLGTPIERRVVPDEAFFQQVAAYGTPEPVIQIMLGFYEAARNGEFAAVDRTLARLLGRPPKSMREVMADRFA